MIHRTIAPARHNRSTDTTPQVVASFMPHLEGQLQYVYEANRAGHMA